MSITLELTPEVERQMTTAATASGLSLEAYLVCILEREAGVGIPTTGSDTDFAALLEQRADDGPPPPEDVRYDRDEIDAKEPRLGAGSLEDFEADLDALAQFSESIPVLPEEAFTRESIYSPD